MIGVLGKKFMLRPSLGLSFFSSSLLLLKGLDGPETGPFANRVHLMVIYVLASWSLDKVSLHSAAPGRSFGNNFFRKGLFSLWFEAPA